VHLCPVKLGGGRGEGGEGRGMVWNLPIKDANGALLNIAASESGISSRFIKPAL